MVAVRTYLRSGGEPFSVLLVKLENPVPLLESLAGSLVDILEETAPVGETGTLRRGLREVTFYRKRGSNGNLVWAAGIGDPAILTDWSEKAPPGTIAEFIRWLRKQNAQFVGQRKKEKASAARQRERARERRKQTREKETARQRKYLTQFRETVTTFAQTYQGRVATKDLFIRSDMETLILGKSESKRDVRSSLRHRLSRRGWSYAHQLTLAEVTATRYFEKTGFPSRAELGSFSERLVEIFGTVHATERTGFLELQKMESSAIFQRLYRRAQITGELRRMRGVR